MPKSRDGVLAGDADCWQNPVFSGQRDFMMGWLHPRHARILSGDSQYTEL